MIFEETPLSGAFVIDLEKRGDERGFFARVFCEKEFAEHGLVTHYCQVNNSLSGDRGTLRGEARPSETFLTRVFANLQVSKYSVQVQHLHGNLPALN